MYRTNEAPTVRRALSDCHGAVRLLFELTCRCIRSLKLVSLERTHRLFIAGNEQARENRLILLILITGSIVLLLMILLGAPLYYYKYGRADTKASISKNPNYGRQTGWTNERLIDFLV